MSEVLYYRSFDGQVLYLSERQPGGTILQTKVPEPDGLTPISTQTTEPYGEDVTIEVDWKAESRRASVSWLKKTKSRNEWYAERSRIANVLRANRGGFGELIFVKADDSRRTLACRVLSLDFENSGVDTHDDFFVAASAQFEAYDGFWRGEEITVTGVATALSELVFPITFDGVTGIVFGTSAYQDLLISAYGGDFYAYPIFDITGPLSSFQILHFELDRKIIFDGSIAAGMTATLDLNVPRSFVDANGFDYWPFLAPETDIQSIRIQPDPIIVGGVNSFFATVTGQDGNTQFNMRYKPRFWGLY